MIEDIEDDEEKTLDYWAGMMFKKRALLYTILALGGLALIFSLSYLLMEADRLGRANEGKFVLLAIACAIFFATMGNLMIVIALTIGRVAEVVDTQSGAILYGDGKVIQKSVRIRWVNNIDFDNSDLNADQKIVIFLADWRPASCTESGFLLQKP
ncbi:hypothetical protein F2P45_25180 [Massilia sp. CCM 8733]|uniref:Uncharacterized protein n=1 Tax=Massilia mucilaginosa TaxID=2609282 RepID=A0ABX0NZD5_9BURK|nr:hypothetical protein [Massilia mucilaginosa]NHZ92272.1 hypothetical protein [Massilia mucilaginosa]